MHSVIICGSRNWPAPWFVTAKIIELVPRGALVITGGARRSRDLPADRCSVDEHAHVEALRLGYPVREMPADWSLGRRGGPIRNRAMLDEGPDLVLAFWSGRSRGTAHMIRETMKRGIRLEVFEEADLAPDLAALDGDWEPISP